MELRAASRADFHFDCQKSWLGGLSAPKLQYRRNETHIFALHVLYYVNGVKLTTQKPAKTLCFLIFRQQGWYQVVENMLLLIVGVAPVSAFGFSFANWSDHLVKSDFEYRNFDF